MKCLHYRARVLAAVVLGLVAVGPVTAEPIFYTDRAAFTANATNLQTIDFEGIAPPGGFQAFPPPAGLTQRGVNFVGATATDLLFVIDPAFSPPLYDWNSGAVLSVQTVPPGVTSTVRVTLPDGITAVGSDIMTILPYAAPVTVTLATG